jgi:type I restriction enzyme S subunit
MSDVPEGYKMSEVGVIPEEWEVKTLGDVSEIIMGQSPAGNSYNQNANGIALINGPTEFTEKYPIKIQWTTLPTKLCKEGDILLCIRGSSTGRMNISNDSYCIGRGVAAIRAKVNA